MVTSHEVRLDKEKVNRSIDELFLLSWQAYYEQATQ